MNRSTRGTAAAQLDTFDPIPYLRGLTQLVSEQRLEYLLSRTRRRQRRRGRLLASSVAWRVIAMSLFATYSIPSVWRALHPYAKVPDPDDSTFTKARRRLGVAPRRALFAEVAPAWAAAGTPGVFYRCWRLMGIDGTVLDMPDTPENARIFGRGGNPRSPNPCPQGRLLALCELGTPVVGDFALRPICHSEQAMVPVRMRSLHPGMLLLWDRGFFGFDLLHGVRQRGSQVLARVKASQRIFTRVRDLAAGSYLSHLYPTSQDRIPQRHGRLVRIIESTPNDPTRVGCGVRNRLLTDLLDPADLPAPEAPLLYHRRWEEELVFDEIKTHLNSREVHLRSKTPRGVVQELYGLFLAHRILRQVMADAAGPRQGEPEALSFTEALRILRSHLPEAPATTAAAWYARLTEEVGRHLLRPRRNRWYPRVVRRRMKKWDKKRPKHSPPPQPSKPFAESVVII
jgi:Insertion element 4 transposase N-terminal/Transposase DDE domain